MGLMALLATVGMLFAAFTAALLVRRTGSDWIQVRLPGIVAWNTVVLVLSSGALEWARRRLRAGHRDGAESWLTGAGALGLLFLSGQVVAWQRLVADGILLPTNPHAAFFYVLSGLHAAHLLGGLGAMAWALARIRRGAFTARHHQGFTHAAIYWHFVGAVWLYLLALLLIL
jgi:cytochrome c oxidase subunit 3